ncbi:hypothetical protein OTU49_003605 [Cherax quadricarinatus]|uniref:Uncharacterized protein n=1 Tax=Cherax quadricarinatus TaxID=27406 RepID=A0AAW0YB71_CHEQU
MCGGERGSCAPSLSQNRGHVVRVAEVWAGQSSLVSSLYLPPLHSLLPRKALARPGEPDVAWSTRPRAVVVWHGAGGGRATQAHHTIIITTTTTTLARPSPQLYHVAGVLKFSPYTGAVYY